MNASAGPAQGKVHLAVSKPWRKIEREFAASGDASGVHAGLVRTVDEMVAGAYATVIEPVLSKGAALLALGEYGRAQLFPYSDINLLIVLEGDRSWTALREVLSEFVRELWDLGLRANHSVRTITECMDLREEDRELKIALLDRRFLAGQPTIFAQLENRLAGFYAKNGTRLAQELCRAARLRYARYQNTVRQLQPDLVECPGALGDLRLISWLERLNPERRHDQSDPLARASAFLRSARCFLHYRARADRNLLDFDAQEAIAHQPFSQQVSRVEWMREYYSHAAAVSNHARRTLEESDRTDSSLLGNFREWRSRLSNTDFTVSRDCLLLRNPAQIEHDPALLLRLVEFMARHDIRLSPSTETRLERARPAFAAYCAAPGPLWAMLKIILALPHAASALRTLQGTGLLGALLPEWSHIENLSHIESGRSRTVDEHVLIACERLAELRTSSDPPRQRFLELLAELDNTGSLIFAVLYHEIGKDSADGGALRLAVPRAAEAARRIEMPPDEQSDVEFLIEHQFDLAEAMSVRDLADPHTSRWLAKRIGTIERLRMLALLTYADLSSASTEALNPWRTEQLWKVVEITRHELTRELETDRILDIPRTLPSDAEFIKGFPTRYLRVHHPAEIESHLQLYEASRPTGVAQRLEHMQHAYRLTIVARDMPFLFASLAGALSSVGLDILKAEAFSNSQGLILDTFVFSDPKRTLEQNRSEVERLQELIRRVALGKTDGQKLFRSRPQLERRERASEPRIHFDSNACETATLVEISTDDRPGLLCSLAAVFSGAGCNIDVVLIDTKGHRPIDVFYVAYEGRKLPAEIQAILKDKLRAAC
jgi:[protein-PII] uridylyltransferase